MSDSINEQHHFAPHDVAGMFGVSVMTVRRWAEYHKAHLSDVANPPPGEPRQFTWADVEKFRQIKAWRDEGLTVEAIKNRLSGTITEAITPTVMANSTSEAIEAPQNEPESQQGAILPLQAIEHYQAIETRLALLERSAQTTEQARQEDRRLLRDGLTMFALGFIAALLFVILLLLLFLARHWL